MTGTTTRRVGQDDGEKRPDPLLAKPLKILLLGELSGLHQELSGALRLAGHQVTVGHSRLAHPGFASDIPFFAPLGREGSRWRQLHDIASQLVNAPSLTGFDIVQIVTPKFFNWKIHGPMMRFLARNNRRLVVVATSCASDTRRRLSTLAYRPCEQCLVHDLKSDRCIYDRTDERSAEYISYGLASSIVVTGYDYGWVVGGTPYADKVVGIPLPIDTNRHRPSPMPPTDKVRIWYGETRFGFKGSAFILPALERLASGPLGDRLEIVRSGRLAFDDYLDFLDTVHIVIDQTSSYGLGMNALYALARGRVTLGGAEPEALAFTGVPAADNPVVNIRPNADQIHAALYSLVERKTELPTLGAASAAYAAKYHAASAIAVRYGDLYRRLLKPAVAPEPGL